MYIIISEFPWDQIFFEISLFFQTIDNELHIPANIISEVDNRKISSRAIHAMWTNYDGVMA